MSYTILIIDDDQDLADALSELLSFEGFQTVVATSGLAGLRHIQSGVPDIIICDWQMPNFNGGELLREVRLSKATADMPFIIITGHMFQHADFEPTAILSKPVSIYTLIDTIKQSVNDAHTP